MADDKPNPLEDLRKGLGLLFRAAKTTIEKLPSEKLEEAVVSGAKEVGRAIENVTHAVEEQFLRRPTVHAQSEKPEVKPGEKADEAKADGAPEDTKTDGSPRA